MPGAGNGTGKGPEAATRPAYLKDGKAGVAGAEWAGGRVLGGEVREMGLAILLGGDERRGLRTAVRAPLGGPWRPDSSLGTALVNGVGSP